MRRSVLSSWSWPGLPRTTGKTLAPTLPDPPPLPDPTEDSLLALGHLQEVEVNYALYVGMEGEEATQEVIPRQAEVGVLSGLSQDLQQEEQGADRPGRGSHGWEAEGPRRWLCLTRVLAT